MPRVEENRSAGQLMQGRLKGTGGWIGCAGENRTKKHVQKKEKGMNGTDVDEKGDIK